MKKLLFFSLILYTFSSFCQENAIYDFENLTIGDVTNQDGWIFSTSLSTSNNAYNCPVIGTPIIPQLQTTNTVGDYISSKAIYSGNGWGNQHVIMSRVNDFNWSFPSFTDRQYLVLTFDMTGGCWERIFRLAYDQNTDSDFGQNCGQEDPNEASFGLKWFGCGNPNYIALLDANSQNVAQENTYYPNWVKYALVIDFYANNNEGSISVFTKKLSDSGDWEAVPTMQNINAGFDINSTGSDNPYNLNGIMLDHEAGINSLFDNFSFSTLKYESSDTTICEGEVVTIGKLINGATFLWSTGETTPTITVGQNGQYVVEVRFDDLTVITDTFNVIVNNLNLDLGNDTSFCTGEDVTLSAVEGMDSYTWQDGDTSRVYRVNSVGTYSITVSKNGCVDSDTIEINEIQPPYVDLGNDSIGCPGDELTLTPSTNATTIMWNDGTTEQTLKVYESGKYYVNASIEQCTRRDSINVTFLDPLLLGNDTTICENDFFRLNLDPNYEDYSWNDGDKKDFKDIHYAGDYYVRVKKLGCTIDSDTLRVNRILLPIIVEHMKDTLICENSPLLLRAYADRNDGIVWHDFRTDTFNLVSTGGIYWAKAYNECGEAIDSVKITSENCLCEEFIPNVFTPNGDGLNDFFGYQSNCIPVNYYNLKIFNRWGELLFDSYKHTEKWDGKFKGRICPSGVYSYFLQVQYKQDKGKRTISRRIKITH